MRYKHIVFDIDGTLIDSEGVALKALQDTILELENKKPELDELKFSCGIPGEVTLARLGIEDVVEGNRLWNENIQENFNGVIIFDGIKALLQGLKEKDYTLGIITSKSRIEYRNDFLRFDLNHYFETVICAEDAPNPKPSPDPMLKYLEITGAKKDDVIYIGDTIYDMQCAKSAGVDFGLALWGCRSVKHIYATYYFNNPKGVLYTLNQNHSVDSFGEMPWLKWAMEIQFIAQAGLTYSSDVFDLERFERLREISAEMMSMKTGIPMERVKDIFCNETGFQTPKLDTRAAIFQDDKILLVKEKNGAWSLPGGWVDVNETIRTNVIKEVKEEAGLDVVPVRLIAVLDRNKHNTPLYAYGISKAFVLCEIIGGSFTPNIETLDSHFFGLDELPPLLAAEKINAAQIRLCFDAYKSQNWETVFD